MDTTAVYIASGFFVLFGANLIPIGWWFRKTSLYKWDRYNDGTAYLSLGWVCILVGALLIISHFVKI